MRDNINIFLLSFFLFLLTFFWINCEKSLKEGELMPNNLNAHYHGGNDGGYYFEILEKVDDKFRIKIYMDYNQELCFEGYFISSDKLCGENLTLNNLQEFISYFNNQKIFLHVPFDKSCDLLLAEKVFDWNDK